MNKRPSKSMLHNTQKMTVHKFCGELFLLKLWQNKRCQIFVWDAHQKCGILFPQLFWLTVRMNCSSDWEKLLKFEAEGQEFEKICLNSEFSDDFC